MVVDNLSDLYFDYQDYVRCISNYLIGLVIDFMLQTFQNLPVWVRHIVLAIFYTSLGASGKEVIDGLNFKPQPVKVSIIVKSEATGKPLSDVNIQFLGDGSPISLKTNSSGYAEIQIEDKQMINVEVSQTGYLAKKEALNLQTKTGQPFTFLLPIDQKAATCFGDSCTNRIPRAAKCDVDATTTNYATGEKFMWKNGDSNIIRIELRFSQNCSVRWAKAISPQGSLIYLQDDKGSKLIEYTVPNDDLQDHHTEMVGNDLKIRACVQNSQGNKQVTCTGFVN